MRVRPRLTRRAVACLAVLAVVTVAVGLPAAARADAPLSAASLMREVRAYAAMPAHLTGTPREVAEQRTIAAKLSADGLQVHSQAYTYARFLPRRTALTVGGQPVSPHAVIPLLYSGTTGQDGVSGALINGGTGTFDPATVAGKIVVVAPGGAGGAATAVAVGPALRLASQGGAAGLIVVTDGPGNLPVWQDVDARAGTGSLPVLEVGRQTGATLLLDATAAEPATITLTAQLGRGCATDVWGTLPGRDPSRRVIVGTPSSSYVPSASERGSGDAIMLGLARYYSELPAVDRPESLVFLATSGHEIGFLGLPALITARPAWFRAADAYIHLGASLGVAVPGGPSHPSGTLSVSENPLLSFVPGAFRAAGAPLETVEPHVKLAGEGAYAYQAGVPTVSFSGGSTYFHTAGDLPRTVNPTVLHREALGFKSVVDRITSLIPGALHAANTRAAAYGKTINPDPTLGAGLSGSAKPQNPRPVSHC